MKNLTALTYWLPTDTSLYPLTTTTPCHPLFSTASSIAIMAAPDSTDLITMDIKKDVKPSSSLHSNDESDELSDAEDTKDWNHDADDDAYVEEVKVTPSKKRKQGNIKAESKVKGESAPSTPTKGGKRAAKSQDSPKRGPSNFWSSGDWHSDKSICCG